MGRGAIGCSGATARKMRATIARPMPSPTKKPSDLLRKSLASGRIHSAYLFSGEGEAPRDAALEFARGLVCTAAGDGARPCEACRSCLCSSASETKIKIDGKGKKGSFYRHIGDHADLYWMERGDEDTRIRVEQVRQLQKELHLHTSEGGRRAAVIAEAEELNSAAQNALLRLLEEPPPLTSLILVAQNATSLLPTVRSRCVRVVFPTELRPILRGDDIPEEIASIVARLDGIGTLGMAELLKWAEEFRGTRAIAAAALDEFLQIATSWLHDRTTRGVAEGSGSVRAELDAYRVLNECRRELTRRNINPQMSAERGLFALRGAVHA